MADVIFEFLLYGVHHSCVAGVSPSIASDFLPSLALLASDSPSLTSSLLAPLASHPNAPRALAYAALDYNEIGRSVLEAEAACKESGPKGEKGLAVDSLAELRARSEESGDEPDESIAFELADEKERVKLAVISLRKCAMEFSLREKAGGDSEEFGHRQYKDDGSMWNNDAYMPELLCLLPITVARCPTLLTPEHVVWGLLTSRWGYMFIIVSFINNPLALKRGLHLISEFVASHKDAYSSGSLWPLQDHTDVVISHCIHQAMLTFLRLYKVSRAVAFQCREALVSNCTFAELALSITVEVIHDELDFLSKLIFSSQKTSQWILSTLGSAEKVTSMSELNTMLSNELDSSQVGCNSRDNSSNNKQAVSGLIRRALLADSEVTRQKFGWCGRLHSHLRLFCVLIRAGDLQPTHDEIIFWLETIGGEFNVLTDKSAIDSAKMQRYACERTLQLGISFCCLVPGLTGPSTKALFHKALSFLLRPVTSGEPKCNSETELAVWLSVQLFLRRFSDIAMIVREALGMHVTIHNSLMRELQDATVAADIISEPSMIVKAVAALRPNGPISSREKRGSLTLKCIEQLLSSGNFIRFGIDISEIIMHCIFVAEEPINHLLIQIIQSFADMHTTATQGKLAPQVSRISSIPHSFLEESFAFMRSDPTVESLCPMNRKSMARAVLVSYYMICRECFLRNAGNDVWHENSDSLIFKSEGTEEKWWSDLLTCLPFRFLLCYMERHWSAYEHIFPQWLSLSFILFPERLLVSKILDDSCEVGTCPETNIHGIPRTDDLEWVGPDVLDANINRNKVDLDRTMMDTNIPLDSSLVVEKMDTSVLLSSDLAMLVLRRALKEPLAALRVLKLLQCNSSMSLGKVSGKLFELYVLVVKELLPLLLDLSCPRSLQDNFCLWWSSVSPPVKESLLPDFLVSISNLSANNREIDDGVGIMRSQVKHLASQIDYQSTRHIYRELVQQPLTLLGCKDEVFRTPLLSVFLDLLTELLTVNRRVSLSAVSNIAKEGTLKQDEISAALVAQDSAVCQILLEECLPNARLVDDVSPGPLLEARKLICGFLSSFLHMNPVLLKLIHFQGYDPRLVPMMVEGVPVMVQCLDFVQELLQQQLQRQQIFAIILISSIALAHPELPQSLTAVQHAVAHVSFIQKKVPSSAEFLCEVLIPMAQCACVFPTIAAEVVSILQSCVQAAGPLVRSGPPRDPALQATAISAFKQIIHRKILFDQPAPSAQFF